MFLLLSQSVISKNLYQPIVSTIGFRGNDKTETYILHREVAHPINLMLDTVLVDEDKNRLENLGLFSEISTEIVPLEDGTVKLIYVVIESIHKTPPLVFPTYDEDTGWSFAGLWMINNFRGRNQSLILNGTFGGRDTYSVSFNDPWIFGDHISFAFNISRIIFEHRFLNRNLELNNFSLKLGKWYGLSVKTQFGLDLGRKQYFNEQYKESFTFFGITGEIRYDTRDIYWNPGKGLLLVHGFYHQNGINPSEFNTTLFTQSLSLYKKISKKGKKKVIAFNTSSSIKYGSKSDLWLEYFGNSSTIRGWSPPDSNLYLAGKQPFRFGHDSFLFSMEFRHELIPKRATQVGTEFGLSLVIFSEFGVIANQWNDINKIIPMQGYGAGIRIPFPIVSVIRVDLAWGYRSRLWNPGVIHFGIGQKF